jgi:cytidylate kinase
MDDVGLWGWYQEYQHEIRALTDARILFSLVFLSEHGSIVRANLARALGLSTRQVNSLLRTLQDLEMATLEDEDRIELTKKGRELALRSGEYWGKSKRDVAPEGPRPGIPLGRPQSRIRPDVPDPFPEIYEKHSGGLRVLLGGLSGTNTTEIAKGVAVEFGLTYVHAGQIFREMATVRGISLEELVEVLENKPEMEKEIDRNLVEAGMGDDVLVQGRAIGWIFPRDPPAVRIWLTCDLEERLVRVQSREHHPRSPDNLLYMDRSESRRYRKMYGIELNDFSPFDLVLDTTKLSVSDAVDRIKDYILEHRTAHAWSRA